MFDHLWAKSAKHEISLSAHTQDVVNALREMFGHPDAPTQLGNRWLEFFCLEPTDATSFLRNCVVAASAHDWGKANDGFQNAVRHQGAQVMRHELLSVLMLALDDVVRWLEGIPDLDQDVVLAAVFSHHLKAGPNVLKAPPEVLIRMQTAHADFRETLEWTAQQLRYSAPLPDFGKEYWDSSGAAGTFNLDAHCRHVVRRRLKPMARSLRADEQQRRMLRAVRSALIAADAVGSARYRINSETWLEEVLDPNRLCTGDYIDREIIEKRIHQIEQSGKPFEWNQFQDNCAELPDRALLLAPCGSGKTLAAWRWIKTHCTQRPVKRVLFLYPTRATATEGFRDYAAWAPEADAALMHGTAAYDLQGMFENGDTPDDRSEKEFEVNQRLFGLGFWAKRVFSATVDQFLGFLQYTYGSMCLIPVLADSVVVVDEVHSFDKSLFSALVEFLKEFRIPVLCMTATLPNSRRAELKDCGMHEYAEKPADLKKIAEAPRYRVQRIDDSDVQKLIDDALGQGRRVLWVVNKVRRAQEASLRFADDPRADRLTVNGLPLLCYHSRFRLHDRKERHQEVVREFQGVRTRAALAITTQVCEMSLDMDADVLVTEVCPITSLIQRMGRCNRYREPRKDAGDVCVYTPPGSTRPYDEKSLAGVDGFLEELSAKKSINQMDLETGLARAPQQVELPDDCQFLSSGPYAMAGEDSLRDIEEFTVPGVLEQDLDRFVRRQKSREPIDGLVVPVPKHLSHQFDIETPSQFPRWLTAAPNSQYHAALGFCDSPMDATENS